MFDHDLSFEPESFSGTTRVFPLPTLVMFPGVMQPLHLFESRYIEMVEDAIAGDRIISMALLEPGWEPDYDSRPPIAPVMCLGKIASSHRLDDGRYNILLLGLQRVRLVRELPEQRSFRRAEVEIIPDAVSDESQSHRQELQNKLLRRFRCAAARQELDRDQFEQLVAQGLPLGALTDIIGYALDLEIELKQELLSESLVDRRAELLIEAMRAAGKGTAAEPPSDESFPPRFSDN